MTKRCRPDALVHTLALAMSVLFLSACSHEPIVPRIAFATEFDKNQSVNVQQGGTLHLELDAPTDDGAQWRIDGTLPAVISLQGQPMHRAYTDAMGSGNTTLFELRAEKVGSAKLALDYIKSSTGETLKEYNITVNVVNPDDVFKVRDRPQDNQNTSEKSWWRFWQG